MTTNAMTLDNGIRIACGGFRSHGEYVGKTVRINHCEIMVVSRCTGAIVLDKDNKMYGRYVYHVQGNMQGKRTTLDATDIQIIK